MWSDYTFEFCVLLSLFILIMFSVFKLCQGKTYFIYPTSNNNINNKPPSRTIVRESAGEIECKKILQSIYRKPFLKVRPHFLRNDVTGGNNLELDCYNPELKLAVEYNGIQHYNFVPFFHKNKEAFLNQKYRDELKRRMCRDKNIVLLEVPYTVKVDKIKDFLIYNLRKLRKLR